MSVLGVLRRLEYLTRPSRPAGLSDYDLPVQDAPEGSAVNLWPLINAMWCADHQQLIADCSDECAYPHLFAALRRAGALPDETSERPPTIHTSGGMSPRLSGDDGDTSAAGATPPAPAALPTVEWLAVAVKEELAEHYLNLDSRGYTCLCDLRDTDPYDWREHVAPIITATVLKCIEGYQKK